VFHLCNRSAGQVPLFQSPYDYRQVLDVLREALEKFPVSLYAYCIMPNHWHLLARGHKPRAISRFMHWFETTHASRWRRSHEAVGQGAVYQNRFRSHPVDGSLAFLKTAAYIERNALAAGLTKEASAWPWGSAFPDPDLPAVAWPLPKPAQWKQLLANRLDAEILREIHQAQISSLPFRLEAVDHGPDERALPLAA